MEDEDEGEEMGSACAACCRAGVCGRCFRGEDGWGGRSARGEKVSGGGRFGILLANDVSMRYKALSFEVLTSSVTVITVVVPTGALSPVGISSRATVSAASIPVAATAAISPVPVRRHGAVLLGVAPVARSRPVAPTVSSPVSVSVSIVPAALAIASRSVPVATV